MLQVLDRRWRDHLYEMDYLKDGIGLRAMAQRDPLIEYQREGYQMFQAMMGQIKEESVGYLYNLEVEVRRADGEGVEARRSRPRVWAPRRSRVSDCSTRRRTTPARSRCATTAARCSRRRPAASARPRPQLRPPASRRRRPLPPPRRRAAPSASGRTAPAEAAPAAPQNRAQRRAAEQKKK